MVEIKQETADKTIEILVAWDDELQRKIRSKERRIKTLEKNMTDLQNWTEFYRKEAQKWRDLSDVSIKRLIVIHSDLLYITEDTKQVTDLIETLSEGRIVKCPNCAQGFLVNKKCGICLYLNKADCGERNEGAK